VLQTAARKRHVPVDCLSHHCRVLKLSQDTIEQQPPPNEGVYVRGLFLAGARWDSQRQTLAEQKPKILWEEMPVLWLNPKSAGDQVDQAEEDRQDTYTCPLYRTSERHGILSTTGHSTNFVMSLNLPTSVAASHWVKRGVALVTQLDD